MFAEEYDKEWLEAEKRLARLRVEAERPTAFVPDPQHQFAQAQGQLHQQSCTSATAGFCSKTPTETRRFRVFIRGGHRVDVRPAGGHPRGDRERQCAQVVELGGPNSDKYATPTLNGGANCPSAWAFIWSRKRDDSVIVGQHGQRQNMGTGAVEWERQATWDHRNHCCGDEALSHSLPFRRWFPESNGLRCPKLWTATMPHEVCSQFQSHQFLEGTLRKGVHGHVPHSWEV